ncbi:N-acetylmuramoyl-L-alanine amidase [Virgibacillus xinjiangensis]|uniref:N-acetylmuramoyl-L-alanine amidase n=1 Tax=Virgibacillus xinjiangensis TaxID=393090 RepID=A0ABV7CXP5_9BACI
MKIYLDPGHGGNDPGAVGHGLTEKEVVWTITTHITSLLQNNYGDVKVKMSRSQYEGRSLAARTKEANSWKADLFLSIHCNASGGMGNGYEDFIYHQLAPWSRTAGIQQVMHKEISKAAGLRDRGSKSADFHVLRETNMPALLTENGFIDHPGDAAKMRTNEWYRQVAEGHVLGLEKAFSLNKKGSTSKDKYLIIAGSFHNKEYAQLLSATLHKASINVSVSKVHIQGRNWYRVQTPAFPKRLAAEMHLQGIKECGIKDAYIIQV